MWDNNKVGNTKSLPQKKKQTTSNPNNLLSNLLLFIRSCKRVDRRQTLSITRLYKNHKNKKKNYILIFTVGIFLLTHSVSVLPLKALNELKTFFVSFYDYRKIAKLSSIQRKDLIFMVGWNDYRYYNQPDRHSSMDLKWPATGMFPKCI